MYNIMSFIKNLIKKTIFSKQNQISKPNDKNRPSMTVMQSNTLGITVIQQTTQNDITTRQLTNQQWEIILSHKKLDGIPYNRIYFSFLKGIPNQLRMKIWLMLCTENSSRNFVFSADSSKILTQQIKLFMDEDEQELQQEQQQQTIFTIFTLKLFTKLIESKPKTKQLQQIQKDISRTYPFKEKYQYTASFLRRILYALSNSGIQYAQGMNYMLLYIIIFCLESLGINKDNFCQLTLENQRDIFIIMREIVLRLNHVFDNQGMLEIIKELEEKISQNTPDIFFNIHKYGMDTYGLFSPNYYSLLTYSDPPDELAKKMFDLFFLESHKAITSLIVRMLEIAHDEIMKIKDGYKLQKFIRQKIFQYCFVTLSQEQLNAKSISDFGISFYQHVDLN